MVDRMDAAEATPRPRGRRRAASMLVERPTSDDDHSAESYEMLEAEPDEGTPSVPIPVSGVRAWHGV